MDDAESPKQVRFVRLMRVNMRILSGDIRECIDSGNISNSIYLFEFFATGFDFPPFGSRFRSFPDESLSDELDDDE